MGPRRELAALSALVTLLLAGPAAPRAIDPKVALGAPASLAKRGHQWATSVCK
jgi:hypothetical protein